VPNPHESVQARKSFRVRAEAEEAQVDVEKYVDELKEKVRPAVASCLRSVCELTMPPPLPPPKATTWACQRPLQSGGSYTRISSLAQPAGPRDGGIRRGP
jgi:hypothetical protein